MQFSAFRRKEMTLFPLKVLPSTSFHLNIHDDDGDDNNNAYVF